jgi:hypothetical protein
MSDKLYNVIFSGKINSSKDIETVKKNLSILFKLDQEKINHLLIGKPMIIKKNIDYPTANKYHSALTNAGLLCNIQAVKHEHTINTIPLNQGRTKPISKNNIACPKCRFEQFPSDYCVNCGINIEDYKLEIQSLIENVKKKSNSNSYIKKEHFVYFIRKNVNDYLKVFLQFNRIGVDYFSFTWHWSAFFYGPAWMLYRKLNNWALAAYILYLFPPLNIISSVVWGLTAYYIYYKYTTKEINKIKNKQESENINSLLSKAGGVNNRLFVTLVHLFVVSINIFMIISRYKK